MPVSNSPSVRDLATALLAKQKLARTDVDGLLTRALEDQKLTTAERTQIRSVVDKFAAQTDSADAVQRLRSFLDIKGDTLRVLSSQSESNDGVIDAAEAKRILDVVNKDGRLGANDKTSLQAILRGCKLTDEARDVLKVAIGEGGGTPPPPAGTLHDIGLKPLDGKSYGLSADGHITSGPKLTFDAAGAMEMYRGAEALVGTRGTPPLKGVPTALKLKLFDFLQSAFVAGKDTGALPDTTKQRIRSAAATTLLELVEGATAADGDLKKKALDLYLAQGNAEPLHGLRASMFFNLERVGPSLDAGQAKALADLKASVVPAKPPYDEWFAANGGRSFNVKHYAHKECWDYATNPVDQYKAQGFTVVDAKPNGRPPTWVLEKTNNNAPGGAVKARVELVQSHDGIFTSMDDPKTNVILYTGHSNLGGNVSEELRLGANERGSKLVMLAMCRGKQNMHEVANKYPSAHFVTTDNPSYFSSVMPMALGMVEGCLQQRDYEAMKKQTPAIYDVNGKDNYFYPHEPRRYAYYDVDKDGLIDGKGAHRDRIFNLTLRPPTTRRMDGVVRPNTLNPRELDGTHVDHATAFLNTLVTYHVDHGNHTSKFTNSDMDAFLAGGWFDGPADEKVRIQKNSDGTMAVSVNKGLHDQSWAVLGTIVQFEVAKQLLMERNGGQLTKDDEARAMLFAGEYLSYMYCSAEEADQGIAAIAKGTKFFQGTRFDHLYKAVEADGHGYVTDAQMKALIALRP
ncbi:MAG: hypothetical protein HYS27_05525 [Deltaproteobacteria bacterium]|nr:hypothetical protein [Deltaproteobacteria bacterium]